MKKGKTAFRFCGGKYHAKRVYHAPGTIPWKAEEEIRITMHISTNNPRKFLSQSEQSLSGTSSLAAPRELFLLQIGPIIAPTSSQMTHNSGHHHASVSQEVNHSAELHVGLSFGVLWELRRASYPAESFYSGAAQPELYRY